MEVPSNKTVASWTIQFGASSFSASVSEPHISIAASTTVTCPANSRTASHPKPHIDTHFTASFRTAAVAVYRLVERSIRIWVLNPSFSLTKASLRDSFRACSAALVKSIPPSAWTYTPLGGKFMCMAQTGPLPQKLPHPKSDVYNDLDRPTRDRTLCGRLDYPLFSGRDSNPGASRSSHNPALSTDPAPSPTPP